MQKTIYKRITNDGREEISRYLAIGKTQAEIARALGRHPATIPREIHRNRGKSGYRAVLASKRAINATASRRKGKSRLEKDTVLRKYVIDKLKQQWSPRMIFERLKMEYPLDMTKRISHEAIYRYIYVLPRGELKRTLIQIEPLARADPARVQALISGVIAAHLRDYAHGDGWQDDVVRAMEDIVPYSVRGLLDKLLTPNLDIEPPVVREPGNEPDTQNSDRRRLGW